MYSLYGISKKTIEKKNNKKWEIDCIYTERTSSILTMLCEDLFYSKLRKYSYVKRIREEHNRIIVYYDNGYRAIYE